MRSDQPRPPCKDPSIDAAADAPGDAATGWPELLGRLLKRLLPYLGVTLLANTAIAVLLTAVMPHHEFAAHFVYSQFIGLSILLLVIVPRLTYWPRKSLSAWQAALHLAAATVIGLVGGSFGASLVLGTPPLIRTREPGDNVLLVVSLITILASVGCSSFFWLRERVVALQLEASRERARAQAERARAEAASRQATEAQLNLVLAQLEPHMLFNTLANLRSLMTIDPPRAQLMADRLISFLRATLAASRHDQVTLREEFDLLRDYLELIAIRMGPRLSFSLHLPPELAAVRVLPLLLQPLVENAVRHGLEPAIDGGRIAVRALIEDGQLVLQVEDSGVGYELPPALGNPGGGAMSAGGFGLTQVRERLATAYGAAAGVAVESPWPPSQPPSQRSSERATGGTRIRLTLPAPSLAARPASHAEFVP